MSQERERDRLESLGTYGVLDSAPEADFDMLPLVAASSCSAPIAVVSLVDDRRAWHKARLGPVPTETRHEQLRCFRLLVDTGQPLLVRDLAQDDRFAGDPLVRDGALRSFAGVPLVGRDGLVLGALAVLDSTARSFTLVHLSCLQALARQAVALLELRRLDRRMGHLPLGPGAELAQPGRLRQALEAGELVPWFQPIVDLDTMRVAKLEALLRWQHPQAGVIAPAAFLPAVEASGLILPVGRRVLADSLRLLKQVSARACLERPLIAAVNVAAPQLVSGACDSVLTILQEHDVQPEHLSLELTESAVLLDRRQARVELQRLRSAGVRIALDDYGTGYSNLQRLLELPLSSVKLDRWLVHRAAEDPRAFAVLVTAVLAMKELGLTVVAEGIETDAHLMAARDLGCQLAQGYLLARPQPAGQLDHVVQQHLPLQVPPSSAA